MKNKHLVLVLGFVVSVTLIGQVDPNEVALTPTLDEARKFVQDFYHSHFKGEGTVEDRYRDLAQFGNAIKKYQIMVHEAYDTGDLDGTEAGKAISVALGLLSLALNSEQQLINQHVIYNAELRFVKGTTDEIKAHRHMMIGYAMWGESSEAVEIGEMIINHPLFLDAPYYQKLFHAGVFRMLAEEYQDLGRNFEAMQAYDNFFSILLQFPFLLEFENMWEDDLDEYEDLMLKEGVAPESRNFPALRGALQQMAQTENKPGEVFSEEEMRQLFLPYQIRDEEIYAQNYLEVRSLTPKDLEPPQQ